MSLAPCLLPHTPRSRNFQVGHSAARQPGLNRRTAATAAWLALTTVLTALLTGCAGLNIDDRSYRAVGQDSRAQFLILHYTALNNEQSIQVLTQQKVSSHYLVTDEPTPRILRLVDENRRAWHAGVSAWAGHTMLNGNSIGIEIVNAGNGADSAVFVPYPEAQVQTVLALVEDIVRRHEIRPDRVLGHSDIAPQRKVDPGPAFPWKRLAERGLVAWPDAGKTAAFQARHGTAVPPVLWFQKALARLGFLVYDHGDLDENTRKVLSAFQMKYRPSRWDGQPDAETAALLSALSDTPWEGVSPP